MLTIQIIFWTAAGLVFWTYFGYPIALRLLASRVSRPVDRKDICPDVSIVITAYNEEKRIAQKIENALALDYPRERMDILVVSDGSSDATEEIVRSYAGRGVRLLALPERHGKHYGQGRGIEAAQNDIVILTDATTYLESDGVRKIVRNFADESVGCVSGEDRMQSAGASSSGEGLYVRYEMMLRSQESAVGSLVGVSGCFFAVRKSLCRDWIDNMSADFYMPIIAYQRGFRTVLESEAIGYYEVLHEPHKEFLRKVRTVVHGLEVLFHFKGIMNPVKYGTYAWQMASHKLSRWLVPLYLIIIFLANVMLADYHAFYTATMLLQIFFYGLAVTAYFLPPLKNFTLFRVPLFFVMVNASILVAWYYFLIGKEFILWEPTKR